MEKPAIINAIERNYEIEFGRIEISLPTDKAQQETAKTQQIKDFMRYGANDSPKYKYLIHQDQIIGLYLRSTPTITSFSFLKDPSLQGLVALNLSGNGLESLTLPKTLQDLQYLDVSDNKGLQKVTFEDGLSALKTIDASDSGMTSIHFPKGFTRLKKIDCSRNKLTNCTLDGDMPQLDTLDLSGNELTDFTLPNGFEQLRFLYFKDNKTLQNLELPDRLPSLEVLNLVDNQLRYLPDKTILNSPLLALYASGYAPKNIPELFLKGSTYTATNCLETALIWFKELRDNPTEANEVIKLMITGNGNVGKTTVMCALNSKQKQCVCTKNHSSTHGVQIGEYVIKDNLKMNYWDFGGQEVYHGTHRLFLSTAAVQLIVFDPLNEKYAQENKPKVDRITNELIYNRPIQYFYNTNYDLSKNSQFIFVQNKKALIGDIYQSVKEYVAQKGGFVQVDARKGVGMVGLNDAIEKAAKSLPDYGMVWPKSWILVRQFFIDNIDEVKPVEERQRIIKKSFYYQLCEEKGVNKATQDLLLEYLHHSGFLYQHDELGDDIIADQRWALDAIYEPLTRGTAHYEAFKRLEGKISIRHLFTVFGKHYKKEHKWLFVSFMASCGLCFKLNTSDSAEKKRSLEDIYLFPEFLSAEEPKNSANFWKKKATDIHIYRHKLSWTNYYIIHSFICAVGRKTDYKNIWRNGIHIATDEGWFKVFLEVINPQDKPQEVYVNLFIEEEAKAKWLIPVLEEFRGKYDIKGWKESTDLGKSYKDFDAEKWKNRLGNQSNTKIDKAINLEADSEKSSLTQLEDAPQNIEKPTRGIKKRAPKSDITTDQKVPYEGEDFLLFNGEEKTKFLFLSANPDESTDIKIRKENREIIGQINRGEHRNKLEVLHPNLAVTNMGLLDAMNNRPHIIHFAGHGIQKGILIETENGASHLIETLTLEHLFRKVKSSARCVLLNSCYSSEQAKVISRFGMFVIGYNVPVDDEAAISFAKGFYSGIIAGNSFRESFGDGCFIWRTTCAISPEIIEVWKDGQLLDI